MRKIRQQLLFCLDGIEWRSSAESASEDIAFDEALWKRIFSETNTFLKDSHFTKDDINVDINTATQRFLEGKAAMFHGYPALMQDFQESLRPVVSLVFSHFLSLSYYSSHLLSSGFPKAKRLKVISAFHSPAISSCSHRARLKEILLKPFPVRISAHSRIYQIVRV